MIKAALSMPAIFTINSIFWVIFHSHFNAPHSPCLLFKLSLCIFYSFISNKKVTSDYIRALAPSKFTLMLKLERFSKLYSPPRFSFFLLPPQPRSFLGREWSALARSKFEKNWEFKSLSSLRQIISISICNNVAAAHVNSDFGSSQRIISHLSVAFISAFPTPTYSYCNYYK